MSVQNIINEVIDEAADKTNFTKLLEVVFNRIYEQNKDELLKDMEALNIKISNNFKTLNRMFPTLTIDDYRDQVMQNIENNNYDTLLLYIKSPTRQNIFEPLQLAILERYFGFEIKRFNKSKFKDSKTFDGIHDNITFQCKYINESGGAQDNQFNDLISFNVKQDRFINYLVISGEYGIAKMNTYLKNHNLEENTNVIILNEDVKIISHEMKRLTTPPNRMKEFNKYYSTNTELIYEILENMDVSNVDVIVEPFAGDCDLIKQCLTVINEKHMELFDITKIEHLTDETLNISYHEKTDTLLNNVFEQFNNVFVITNPPYTAKNKLTGEMKMKYKGLLNDIQDLYQIFIKQLIDNENNIEGGFVVIPMNFIFGKQSRNLRNHFLSVYNISVLNIYENQVFDYTTQSVVSMLFYNKKHDVETMRCYLHRSDLNVVEITEQDIINILNYDINEEFKHDHDNVKLTRNYNPPEEYYISNIKLSLIDPNISANISVYDGIETDKHTDRSHMRLCFNVILTNEQEERFCELFNEYLNDLRTSTYSLVLSSYREYDRKRLTFEEAYVIGEFIVNEEMSIT